jgi:hypothetical protein
VGVGRDAMQLDAKGQRTTKDCNADAMTTEGTVAVFIEDGRGR